MVRAAVRAVRAVRAAVRAVRAVRVVRAVRAVRDEILQAIREARRAAAAEGKLRGAFTGGISAILAHRETVSLALRYRRDPGPLGETFRSVVERGRDELHSDMVNLGMVAADDPVGLRLAHYTVGLTLSAVEALLDGEITDIETVATDLTSIALRVIGGWS